MAYVDFSDAPLPPAHDGSPKHDVGPAALARLSALEWSVVALAQRDRLSSLARPGRVSIALGKVFGTRRTGQHLADPKLEALRRIAVLSWHHGVAVPAAEVVAFFRAGFTAGQYKTIAASIAAARSREVRA